jgi:catechol 2,3-dioxygenase-like lactoylglutathione lyase family enzyme
MTKRIHIAIAVSDYEASLREYTGRLGVSPCCTVDGAYALWRTDQVNFSISVKPAEAGRLRHLGFEDAGATGMGEERDVNGVVWERFTIDQQRAEILRYWPHATFHD